MSSLVIRALVSGVIVAAISEAGRRSAAMGALLASLPVVALLGMAWLWRDSGDLGRLSAFSTATFWYVLPSLPMFLVMPWLWRHGLGFWPGLVVGCTLTVALYIGMAAVLSRFGAAL